MPTLEQITAWLAARGVDETQTESVRSALATLTGLPIAASNNYGVAQYRIGGIALLTKDYARPWEAFAQCVAARGLPFAAAVLALVLAGVPAPGLESDHEHD